MASQGPSFPGTVTTETGPSGDNDWTNPGNIVSDNGSEAQITAASYDAGDHSFRLKAQNFGFTIPDGSTIDGIVVEIDRRDFAGDAQDQEVRLYDSTGALVGDDKQTATSWPATSAVATYGSSSDTWNAGLDVADINSANFGVALIVLANSANTDIGVDYIRVTVHYTEGPITVTPTTRALTLSMFAPTVTTSDHKLVTPTTVSLVVATFAPAVTIGVRVVPSTVALSITNFAPTVTVSDNKTVTPGVVALTIATFAPTVTASDHKVVTPGALALTLTGFAPTVIASDHKVVTPGTLALVLSAFAPTVTASDHRVVTPGVLALSFTTFAPTVTVDTGDRLVVPGTLALVLTTYPPTVSYLPRATFAYRFAWHLNRSETPTPAQTQEELYEEIFGDTPPISYREIQE